MLTVSRRDVRSDRLEEFDPRTRFIKLPIENYLRMLPAPAPMPGSVYDNLNTAQRAFINAINDPKYRMVVAAFARRLGKTFMANIVAHLVTLVPNYNVLIMSPNYALSSISFELQRRLLKQFSVEVEKDNLKDKVIELQNGSTVRMGSISTVDSCVGRSYDLILFDEAALSANAEDAFNISLRPTLDRLGSKAVFISTPRGKNNWFSKFYMRGFSDDYPEWCSMHADYRENDRMQEADVQEARRSMTKAHFEQEYMASFTSFEGQIYQLPEDCVQEYEHRDGTEYFGGLDPGYKDPTALVIVAFDYTKNKFHVVDEYLESEAVTSKHAAAIKEKSLKWGVETIFIDHAAAQFAADLAYEYDIATIKAKKSVLDGIGYVQNLVERGELLVSPHCEHTLQMLDQYKWDTRETLTQERPVHDEYSHIADALRYALYSYVV